MEDNTQKIIPTDIDIILCTTSGEIPGQAGDDGHDERSEVSRQGRPRGGEATEWHQREPQAPEGKNSDVEVLHYGSIEMLGSLVALCDYRRSLSRMRVEGGDLHWGCPVGAGHDYGGEVAAHAPEDRL